MLIPSKMAAARGYEVRLVKRETKSGERSLQSRKARRREVLNRVRLVVGFGVDDEMTRTLGVGAVASRVESTVE